MSLQIALMNALQRRFGAVDRYAFREDQHPRDESGRFSTKEKIGQAVADGPKSLSDVADATGIAKGPRDNPLKSELNRVLKAMVDSGELSIKSSGFGEPSFEKTDKTPSGSGDKPTDFDGQVEWLRQNMSSDDWSQIKSARSKKARIAAYNDIMAKHFGSKRNSVAVEMAAQAGPMEIQKPADIAKKEPTAAEQWAAVPEFAQQHLTNALERLSGIVDPAIHAKNTLGDRYGWEVAAKSKKQLQQWIDAIDQWKDSAVDEGIDADAVIEHLGGMPDIGEFRRLAGWGDEVTAGTPDPLESQHPKQQDNQSKPEQPGVEGMQMGLFNTDSGGQKSLFNVAKPSSKQQPKTQARIDADAVKAITAGLDAKLKQHIAKKETVSPADRGTVVQKPSIGGQKTLFSRPLHSYPYAKDNCNWITLRPNPGQKGVPVCVGEKGKITKGPKALLKRSIKSLGKQSTTTKRRNAIRSAAKKHELDPKELQQAVKDIWPQVRQFHQDREEAKKRARALTGFTERQIAKIENDYMDHSSISNWDEVANEMAMEYPHLFGNDPEGELWDMVREGVQPIPPMHSDEVIDEAVEYLMSRGSGDGLTDETIVDGDVIPFSRERHGLTVTR